MECSIWINIRITIKRKNTTLKGTKEMKKEECPNKACLVYQQVDQLIQQIDGLSNDNKYFYLNIFNVDRNVTQKEIEDLFEPGLVDQVIPLGQDGVVYDLQFTSKINLFKVAQQRSFNLRNREIYIRNSIKNRHQNNNNGHYGNRYNRGQNRNYRGRRQQNNYNNNSTQHQRRNYNNDNQKPSYNQRNQHKQQNIHLSRKGQDFGTQNGSGLSYYKQKDYQKYNQTQDQMSNTNNYTGLAKVKDNEYVIIDNENNQNFYKQRNFKNKFQKQNNYRNNTQYVKKIDQLMDLQQQMEKEQGKFDFDFFVIGGGSGGLAAAQKAADLGKKVGLADFVQPSYQGTTWGLGGTCVNVGCIPKKLMHQVSLFGEQMEDMQEVGWTVQPKAKHDWKKMLNQVNNHVRSLNWGYKSTLSKKGVEYFNMLASMEEEHTIKLTDKDGKEKTVTADHILIAVGGRPSFLDVEGCRELCQSSDDIFWSKEEFGKSLVIGAGYIAMECGGFLNGLGKDVTILYRSQPLRTFDSGIADRLVEFMKNHSIKFLKGNATKFEKNGDKIRVTLDLEGKQETQEFDNVLLAVGRTPETAKLNLKKVNIETNKKGQIKVNEKWQSSVPNIYAVGDVIENALELTPVAIKQGRYLVDGIFNNNWKTINLNKVPTTVFTPLEYSCCGLSEDKAVEQFGEDNIEVYHSEFKPLEWNLTFNHYEDNAYVKLVVDRNERTILGAHYLGPNAGEVMQGFSIAIAFDIKFEQLDEVVGIHPTCAEELVTLVKTKREFPDAKKEGC